MRKFPAGPWLRLSASAALAASLAAAPFPAPARGRLRVYLLDVSGSVRVPGVSPDDRLGPDEGMRWILSDAARLGPADAVALVLVGPRAVLALPPGPPDRLRGVRDGSTTGPDSGGGPGTDLAGALRLAAGLDDPERDAGILLLSDGRCTTGDPRPSAAAAAAKGIPVSVLPLGPSRPADARICSVAAPARVPPGTAPVIRVVLAATLPAGGVLRLRAGDRILAERNVALPAETPVAVDLPGPPVGPGGIRAELILEGVSGDAVRENDVVPLRIEAAEIPKVRILSAEPEIWTAVARDLLPGADAAPLGPDEDPSGADLILLAGLAADRADRGRLDAVRDAVAVSGSALLVIGGPDALGPGGYVGSPLDPLLPVDPFPSETFAAVILLDRSGSMSHDAAPGRSKWISAVDAIPEAARVLGPADRAGLILFADTHEAAVPLDGPSGPAPLLAALDRLRRIRPTGGTAWGPPFATAAGALAAVPAGRRHVLLITDGETRETPAETAAAGRRLAEIGAALSIVRTGDPPDRKPLDALREAVPGAREISASGTADLATALREVWTRARSLYVDGIPAAPPGSPPGFPADLPPLAGIQRTTLRPGAVLLLRAEVEGIVPVLARRPAGSGSAAALLVPPGAFPAGPAGDAARRWIGDRIRESIRSPSDPRLVLGLETRPDRILLTLEAREEGRPVAGLRPVVRLAGGDASEEFALRETEPGTYRAEQAEAAAGTREARVTVAWPDGRRTGTGASLVLPPPAEWSALGPDREILDDLRKATGGSWIGADGAAGSPDGRWKPRPGRIPWLILALALYIADLLVRTFRR